ncbi:chemokine-like receptor 1 [Gouania willdenowi]|uniref:Chemokine-like receptor 1 n=1 Tax=Gouania willdenowi TaxID=441366 RepID=A0A8C5HHP0_GOUWI|nr:chemokine-like receptor 1 [Gouania willdenowi]
MKHQLKNRSETFRPVTKNSERQRTLRNFFNIRILRKVTTMDMDYVEYEDYTLINETENQTNPVLLSFHTSQSSLTHVLVAINVIISVFGFGGNFLVIWICGRKMKLTVITTWYVSLAISNILFCTVLPLEVFYMITSHWPFGQVLCKLTSSALFLNMYSSVFLLVLICTDRCIMVLFPVWSHNHRKVNKAFGAVALVWLFSAILTVPSLIIRETTVHGSVTQCHTKYIDHARHKTVALTRFTCGFLIPFLMILICCSVLCVKIRTMTMKSPKPYKIMAALILSFFFCWVPYHTFVLLELDFKNQSLKVLESGLRLGTTLAAANSVVSPVLYVFVGNDFKKTLRKSLTSRMEAAMAEDLRTGGLSHSRSKTMNIIQS